ncbi:MAG: VWA domain-containing protein, partial [Clostridia bacterium]|nr:VWA domain-containing protein [Clostridia bacterium]
MEQITYIGKTQHERGIVMRKGNVKRALSLFLALFMVFSTIPMGVFAAGADTEVYDKTYVTVHTENDTQYTGQRWINVRVYLNGVLQSGENAALRYNQSNQPGKLKVTLKSAYTSQYNMALTRSSTEGGTDGAFTNGSTFSIGSYTTLYLNIFLTAKGTPVDPNTPGNSVSNPLTDTDDTTNFPPYPAPGAVAIDKSASWVDGAWANGVTDHYATVNLNVSAVPTYQGIDVVMVVDRSGSMGYWGDNAQYSNWYECSPCTNPAHKDYAADRTYGGVSYHWKTTGCRYRIDELKTASDEFLTKMYANYPNGTASDNRVAMVSFSDSATSVSGGDSGFFSRTNYTALSSGITNLNANGGTSYNSALDKAAQLINGRSDKSRPVMVLFMSDGQDNGSTSASNLRAKVSSLTGFSKLYTVGLTVPSGATAKLSGMADSGCYYPVTDASNLGSTFTAIASYARKAATEAVITDTMGDKFNFVEPSAERPLVVKVDGAVVATITNNDTSNVAYWDNTAQKLVWN